PTTEDHSAPSSYVLRPSSETGTAMHLEEDEALALAAALEGDSEHIIARAIVAAAHERGLNLPHVRDFSALPGRGVQATVDGRTLQIGGPRLLESEQIALPDDQARQARVWG